MKIPLFEIWPKCLLQKLECEDDGRVVRPVCVLSLRSVLVCGFRWVHGPRAPPGKIVLQMEIILGFASISDPEPVFAQRKTTSKAKGRKAKVVSVMLNGETVESGERGFFSLPVANLKLVALRSISPGVAHGSFSEMVLTCAQHIQRSRTLLCSLAGHMKRSQSASTLGELTEPCHRRVSTVSADAALAYEAHGKLQATDFASLQKQLIGPDSAFEEQANGTDAQFGAIETSEDVKENLEDSMQSSLESSAEDKSRTNELPRSDTSSTPESAKESARFGGLKTVKDR